MMGYIMALWVDQASGVGLAEQQDSFFGKVLLHVVIFGCLFIRETSQLEDFKTLFDEATFYDKQWNETWTNVERPSKQKKTE